MNNNKGHACCKKIPGGICSHELEDLKLQYDLKIKQLEYDLGRPGLQRWEADRIKEQIANLPNPKDSNICEKCKTVLSKNETHQTTYDGSQGEYTYYTCQY